MFLRIGQKSEKVLNIIGAICWKNWLLGGGGEGDSYVMGSLASLRSLEDPGARAILWSLGSLMTYRETAIMCGGGSS